MHRRFIYRQITSSLKQTYIFVACVALALVTLVSIGGFGESVNNALQRDARKLLAADVVVESHFPFEEKLEAELNQLENEPGMAVARTYEFITIVRETEGENSLLSELKVVENGYPFYGEVQLARPQSFVEVLKSGQILVAQNLLDRMALQVGDELRVGEATLTIAAIVLSEPDRPVDFFSFGPRIFISASDLDAIGLIKLGSHVHYRTLLRVTDEAELDEIASRLTGVADPRQVQVDTFRTNQSGVERFFENFLTFLSLIGIFTLLLAGIGIQSSLGAFIREREETIAILRTLGANGRFIMRQFFGVAAILGVVGTLIGLALGIALQWVFPALFGPFLPPQVEFVLSTRAMLEGVLLGFFVVTIFTFLPIYQLQDLKPRFIFRKESGRITRDPVFFLAQGLILLFLSGMTFRYLQDTLRTAYFAVGIVVLVLIISLLARSILYFLRRQNIKSLASRQALRGLFRPRNATVGIIVTLGASLSVLFTIYLIERNLDESLVQAYPEDAPNVFLLDIQREQRAGVEEILAQETEFVPLIRAHITHINGVPIPANEADEARPNRRGPTNDPPQLGDQISITYRDVIHPAEQLVAGDSIFRTFDPGLAQVSINERFLAVYPFVLGDLIQFEIQGVPLDAEVSSIRTVTDEEESFAANFNFVLREQDLAGAPQSIVTAVKISPADLPGLQNQIVEAFPNVTVIDISATIDVLAGIVADMTTIIRFFTIFSIIAGVLIIISSVLATRLARIQEAVYFKVLGARSKFVLRVFALENVFIGAVSAFLALFMSQIAGWLLVTRVFELPYSGYWGSSMLLMLFTIALVTTVGLLASVSILQKKPITFLREQTAD